MTAEARKMTLFNSVVSSSLDTYAAFQSPDRLLKYLSYAPFVTLYEIVCAFRLSIALKPKSILQQANRQSYDKPMQSQKRQADAYAGDIDTAETLKPHSAVDGM